MRPALLSIPQWRTLPNRNKNSGKFRFSSCISLNLVVIYQASLRGRLIYPGVAKFGIALDWGSRGRRFKSCHSDQKVAENIQNGYSLQLFVFKSQYLRYCSHTGNLTKAPAHHAVCGDFSSSLLADPTYPRQRSVHQICPPTFLCRILSCYVRIE